MVKERQPFITTKLKTPAPRRDYIPRQGLFQKLEDLGRYKMAVISGEPGSGKTTLVASFLKEHPQLKQRTRWISLDEENDDVFSFWSYFLQAVRDFLGDQSDDIHALFQGIMQKQDIERILVVLINQLQPAEDITIVLDDFHLLRDQFLLETLAFFIKHSSDHVRLIVLTREEIKLYLGELRISGRLLEIPPEDLRFSPAEGLEFLKNTVSTTLEMETARRLNDLAEGWAGGLQLLALAMNHKKSHLLNQVKGLNKYVVDYLSNEILMSIGEEMKAFLIRTSILNHFDAALCDHLLEIDDAGSIIQALLEKNLFITTVHEEERIYRYHTIFKEFLYAHFAALGEEEKDRLHTRAADLYAQAGDYEDSIVHLLAAHRYEEVIDIIKEMRQPLKAWNYLKRIPLEYVIADDDMLFQRLFYHFCNMEFSACDRIADALDDRENNISFRVFRLLRALMEDDDLHFDIGTDLIQQIEKLQASQVTKAMMYLNISIFLAVQDRFLDALAYVEMSMRINHTLQNPYVEFFLLNFKSQIKEAMGDLLECEGLYRQAFRLIEEHPFLEPLRGYSVLGMAGIYMHQLDLARAQGCLDHVRSLLAHSYRSLERGYLFNLMEVNVLSGARAEAIERCDALSRLDLYQNITYYSSLLKYQIFLNRMDQEKAGEFVSMYEGQQSRLLRFEDKLTYARIISMQGRTQPALDVVDTVLEATRKDKIKLILVEALLARVSILSLDGTGTRREILNLLREAIHYSYRNKIRSPFILAGDKISHHLGVLRTERGKDLSAGENSFLYDILSRLEKAPGPDILSEREREVLQVLATGASNREIADILCISISTVKTHMINIYSKLQVSNRVEAVEKGKGYGII